MNELNTSWNIEYSEYTNEHKITVERAKINCQAAELQLCSHAIAAGNKNSEQQKKTPKRSGGWGKRTVVMMKQIL